MLFVKMRAEIHTSGPLVGSGVRLASLPSRKSIDRTRPIKPLAPPSVASRNVLHLRSLWLETPVRRGRPLQTSVGDTNVDLAEMVGAEPSREEVEREPFIKLMRQSYLIGAFTVSVAVKAWEACGKFADGTAELAQRELPVGVRPHGLAEKTNTMASGNPALTTAVGDATPKPLAPPEKIAKPPKAAKSTSDFKSTLPGMVAPLKTGAKDWVGMWWPAAMIDSVENEKAMLEAAENVNATVADLAKLFGSMVAADATNLRKAISDAWVGLQDVLIPRKPAPEPLVPPQEKKKGRFSFVRSLPIVRSFIARKDATDVQKPKAKTDVDTGKPTFQLPVLKTVQKMVANDKVSDKVKTPPKKQESVEEDTKPGTWGGFPTSIPILQSLSSGSGDQESGQGVPEQTKKESASAPTKVIAQTVAKTMEVKEKAASNLTTAKETASEKVLDAQTKVASALTTVKDAASQAADKTVEAKEKAASVLTKAKEAVAQRPNRAAEAKEKTSSAPTTKDSVTQTAANLAEVARKETESALQKIMQRSARKEEPAETKASGPTTPIPSTAAARQESKEVKNQEIGSMGALGAPAEGSGLLDRLSEMAGAVSEKMSSSVGTDGSTNGSSGNGKNADAKVTDAKVNEPVGIGKGLGTTASKVPGGKLGGSFNPKDWKTTKVSKAMDKAVGGVVLGGAGGGVGRGDQGSGGSGGRGGGGDSAGGGGSGEGSERAFPFGGLVLLSIATAVVTATVLWCKKAQQRKTSQGAQRVGLKTAET